MIKLTASERFRILRAVERQVPPRPQGEYDLSTVLSPLEREVELILTERYGS